MKWATGCSYKGCFNRDRMNGYGVFKWAGNFYVFYQDGRLFEGQFKNGRPNGKGRYTNEGTTRFGEWDDGKHKKWLENWVDENKVTNLELNLEDM